MSESHRLEDSMTMSSMPPIQPQDTNADEIRVLGLITFVSILVGAAIGVFDAGLWLKQDGMLGLTHSPTQWQPSRFKGCLLFFTNC